MFAGFTEDDINADDEEALGVKVRGVKPPNHGRNPKRKPFLAKSMVTTDAKAAPVPKEALLASPKETKNEKSNPDLIRNLQAKDDDKDAITTDDAGQVGDGAKEEVGIEKCPEEIASDKASQLEAMRKKQQQMEEENTKRRQVLAKAIADRKKRTVEESQKLKHVQEELQKVDTLLVADVSKLMHCIDEASCAFMEAQKRYDRAEREYVSAKLAVHEAQERKEMLQEHLCKIIAENETRKARKLSRLMADLDLPSED